MQLRIFFSLAAFLSAFAYVLALPHPNAATEHAPLAIRAGDCNAGNAQCCSSVYSYKEQYAAGLMKQYGTPFYQGPGQLGASCKLSLFCFSEERSHLHFSLSSPRLP